MEEDTEEYRAQQIRFPKAVYDKIAKSAKANRRSFNSEVISLLEEHLSEIEQVNTWTPERIEGVKAILKKLEAFEKWAVAHPDESGAKKSKK